MDSSKRSHHRLPITLPIELMYQGRSIMGATRNLSLGGMFITCNEAVPHGARVQLRFDLETLGRSVTTDAIVRWVESASGIGVQFTGLRAQEVWGLQRLIERHLENAGTGAQ